MACKLVAACLRLGVVWVCLCFCETVLWRAVATVQVSICSRQLCLSDDDLAYTAGCAAILACLEAQHAALAHEVRERIPHMRESAPVPSQPRLSC